MNIIERVARKLCESRKFECGQGCCAPICMDVLGVARNPIFGCKHVTDVHGKLIRVLIKAMRDPTPEMIDAWKSAKITDECENFARRIDAPDGWNKSDWEYEAMQAFSDWTAMIDAALAEDDR